MTHSLFLSPHLALDLCTQMEGWTRSDVRWSRTNSAGARRQCHKAHTEANPQVKPRRRLHRTVVQFCLYTTALHVHAVDMKIYMFKVARVYVLVELSEQSRRSVHVYGTVLLQFVIR